MLGLMLCSAHPLKAKERALETTSTSSETVDDNAEGVEGLAAFYANRYNNRRTASGQRYNPAKLTAAHPTLPLGTKVKVINLANNKEVIVTVNDRCRAKSKPFIDLSRAAAKQLGFLSKSIAKVRIIPIGKVAKTDTPAASLASSHLEQAIDLQEH